MTSLGEDVPVVRRLRVCPGCGAITHSGVRLTWPDACRLCRAPFPSPPIPTDRLPVPTRHAAPRTWWTRGRVIDGLRRFYQEHGLAPTSTEDWHRLTGRCGGRGGVPGSRRPYPSFYAVLRYFDTFRRAWAALGIEVGRRQEAWSELEDWYLREGVGLIPRVELARDLHRTPDAIHRRPFALGLHSYQRWGWTLHRF